jgi:F-type H+-transporting ATPase subunit b
MKRTRTLRRHLLAIVGILLCNLFLAATPVLAQEGEASPAETTAGWVFRWLNFAIVFGAIGYAMVKYAGPAFRRHAEEISEQIAEGARAREAAEQQRKEIEAKLAGLEAEVAEMRAQARRDADAEAQRLRALAREEAQKIDAAARAEIVAAERAARMELKALAARQAVERAEALLREELTPKAEAAIFAAFVHELAGSAN